MILMTAFTLGEGLVLVLAARAALPRELFELAAVEGSGPFRALTGITLPLLAPALVLLSLRDTILSFQLNFVPAPVLTDGGRRRTRRRTCRVRLPERGRVPALQLRRDGNARAGSR